MSKLTYPEILIAGGLEFTSVVYNPKTGISSFSEKPTFTFYEMVNQIQLRRPYTSAEVLSNIEVPKQTMELFYLRRIGNTPQSDLYFKTDTGEVVCFTVDIEADPHARNNTCMEIFHKLIEALVDNVQPIFSLTSTPCPVEFVDVVENTCALIKSTINHNLLLIKLRGDNHDASQTMTSLCIQRNSMQGMDFDEYKLKLDPNIVLAAETKAADILTGMFIKDLRETSGVSQNELAKRLGISQPTISRFESDSNIQIGTLRKYLKKLDATGEIVVTLTDGQVKRLKI